MFLCLTSIEPKSCVALKRAEDAEDDPCIRAIDADVQGVISQDWS